MRGYMLEIEQEKKTEMCEYADDLVNTAKKLKKCVEEIGEEPDGEMGQRMGYRRGVKGTGRYGMRSGMGMREDPDMDYREQMHPGMMGYRDPYDY